MQCIEDTNIYSVRKMAGFLYRIFGISFFQIFFWGGAKARQMLRSTSCGLISGEGVHNKAAFAPH